MFPKFDKSKSGDMNRFGELIKSHRERLGLIQREVAYKLDMDTPMLSKIERGERNAKREHVPKLCKLFHIPEEEMLTIWLADKLYQIAKDEEVGLKAMETAEENLKTKKKQKR